MFTLSFCMDLGPVPNRSRNKAFSEVPTAQDLAPGWFPAFPCQFHHPFGCSERHMWSDRLELLQLPNTGRIVV